MVKQESRSRLLLMRLYVMATLGVSVTLSHFCCSNIGCICQILGQLLGNIGCYLCSVKRKVSLKGWPCSRCVEPAWPKSLAREKTAYLKPDLLSCNGSAVFQNKEYISLKGNETVA